jgi:hypothetical protein
MTTRPPPPPVDLITLAYSLALSKEGKAEDARTTTMMDPISEEDKPSASSVVASSAAITGDLDESQKSKELAIQKLLKIADDNKIIIDNHLRRAILGQDETYTSTDAVESIRRSSTSSINKRRSSSCSSSSSSALRGSLINRSRRHLGSLFRKSSSLESSSDKETVDTDSSVSIDSCVRTTLPSHALEDLVGQKLENPQSFQQGVN